MDPVEDNSDSLQRLLAFKRTEQPPPGYFDRLPDRILHRIAAGDAPVPGNWLQALIDQFQLRPALAGLACVVAGAACLLGVSAPERLAPPPLAAESGGVRPWLAGAPAPWPGELHSMISLARSGGGSSMAPVLSTQPPALFVPAGHLRSLEQVQPASYTPVAR